MKAAGYIRVSSEMQADHGHSLDAQRMLISDYVGAKGWTLVTVFSDVGVPGTLSSRPGLQALLERAAKGEFEVVVVHALDRFYRNLPRLLLTLEQLRKHQVEFVSITEQLDFTSPWGKLELAVLGSLAEIYIDKLRAETTKGKWHIPRAICGTSARTEGLVERQHSLRLLQRALRELHRCEWFGLLPMLRPDESRGWSITRATSD